MTAGSHNPTSTAPGDEYEPVVQRIVGRLAKRAQVDTTRLEIGSFEPCCLSQLGPDQRSASARSEMVAASRTVP